MPNQPPNCPKCKSANVRMIGKRNALYPVGCLLILSLVYSIAHRLQSPIDYQCKACCHRFARRNLTEKIALLAIIVFLVVLIGGLAVQVLGFLRQ